jgi:hypothetical protein
MFTKINLATVSCLGALLCASPAIADPCEASLPPSGTEFSGEVTYIVDGDGLCVGREQGGTSRCAWLTSMRLSFVSLAVRKPRRR